MSFNVLTAEISHETNSFSLHKTGKRAFMARYALMDLLATLPEDESVRLAPQPLFLP